MTDTAPKTGLDALVEEAMQRKIVPVNGQQEEPKPKPLSPDAQIDITPVVARETIGPAPDASLAFMVNGVKVLITVHVDPGAKVTLPPSPGRTASAGPKVRGVRNRPTEEAEAVSVAPVAFDATQPIGDDNLPEGWGVDPVVGATPDGWKCPEHGKAVVKKSAVSGRDYVKCPVEGCNQLAPK